MAEMARAGELVAEIALATRLKLPGARLALTLHACPACALPEPSTAPRQASSPKMPRHYEHSWIDATCTL